MNSLSLNWVYFIRRYERQHGNGELEFRSLAKLGFVDKQHQELLEEVIERNSITNSEWFALTKQRLKEVDQELKRRGARA